MEDVSALSAEQKIRADRLVSVFENDSIEIQYDYVENLQDGRGFTAGRSGFTSANGDLLQVIERYTELEASNALAPYTPRLAELAETGNASTSGLDGFEGAWALAAEDSVFRGVQDQVNDELYFKPALCWWNALGLETALSAVVLYDTIIEHGEGTDPDGLPALIERTRASLGGSPREGIDEQVWLRAFLTERTTTLSSACDLNSRDEWAESIARVSGLVSLLDSDNWNFAGPIKFSQEPYTPVTIP